MSTIRGIALLAVVSIAGFWAGPACSQESDTPRSQEPQVIDLADLGAAPAEKASAGPPSPSPSDKKTTADLDKQAIPDVAIEADISQGTVEAPPQDPWHLPQPCVFRNLGIRTSGWLQQGITFNEDHARFNGPVATNDLDHEYQMNQLWLTIERPVKMGDGWDIGGRVDMMYGTDWRFGINNGLETKIDGFNYQTYGMVLPQMYGEVACNNLSVKLGHFAAILDYEAVPAPANPFYSHSYSYGYTVPMLVTGMLADYRLTEQLSVQAGFNRGWQQFEDNNEKLDFMGGIRWQSPEGRTNIAYAIDTGAQDDNGAHNRFVSSLVVKEQLTKRLQSVLVHNLGVEDGAAPDHTQAEWYGLNQYLIYALNPCWSFALRAEWLRDDSGARIAGPGNIPGVRAWAGHSFAGDFYEVTMGLNWRPQPNLVLRPEVRYDWYNGPAGFIQGMTPGMPFNNGQSNSQLLVATDLVWLF